MDAGLSTIPNVDLPQRVTKFFDVHDWRGPTYRHETRFRIKRRTVCLSYVFFQFDEQHTHDNSCGNFSGREVVVLRIAKRIISCGSCPAIRERVRIHENSFLMTSYYCCACEDCCACYSFFRVNYAQRENERLGPNIQRNNHLT